MANQQFVATVIHAYTTIDCVENMVARRARLRAAAWSVVQMAMDSDMMAWRRPLKGGWVHSSVFEASPNLNWVGPREAAPSDALSVQSRAQNGPLVTDPSWGTSSIVDPAPIITSSTFFKVLNESSSESKGTDKSTSSQGKQRSSHASTSTS